MEITLMRGWTAEPPLQQRAKYPPAILRGHSNRDVACGLSRA
jgi:hypothetical protein